MTTILFFIGLAILLIAALFYFIYKSLIDIYERLEEIERDN